MSWAETKKINSNLTVPLNDLVNRSVERHAMTEDIIKDLSAGNIISKIRYNPHLKKYNYANINNETYELDVDIKTPDGSENTSVICLLKYIKHNDKSYGVFVGHYGVILCNYTDGTYSYLWEFDRVIPTDYITNYPRWNGYSVPVGEVYYMNGKLVIICTAMFHSNYVNTDGTTNSSNCYYHLYNLAGIVVFNEDGTHTFKNLLNNVKKTSQGYSYSSIISQISNYTSITCCGRGFSFAYRTTYSNGGTITPTAMYFDVIDEKVTNKYDYAYATLRTPTTSYSAPSGSYYYYVHWDANYNMYNIPINGNGYTTQRGITVYAYYVGKYTNKSNASNTSSIYFAGSSISASTVQTRIIDDDNLFILHKNGTYCSAYNVKLNKNTTSTPQFTKLYEKNFTDSYDGKRNDILNIFASMLSSLPTNMIDYDAQKMFLFGKSASMMYNGTKLKLDISYDECYIVSKGDMNFETLLNDITTIRNTIAIACVENMQIIIDKALIYEMVGDYTVTDYGYKINSNGSVYIYLFYDNVPISIVL